MKSKLIATVVLSLLLFSCGNGKSGKNYEPYDGGHGIGIDTQTVNEIQRYQDSIKAQETIEEKTESNSPGTYSSSRTSESHYDNMRGFDPPSEDDMDDNGMSRYMDNNDEEGWD